MNRILKWSEWRITLDFLVSGILRIQTVLFPQALILAFHFCAIAG